MRLLIFTFFFTIMVNTLANCPVNSILLDRLNHNDNYAYNQNELTKVFFPKKKVEKVILLLHGLNLRPSKMDSLANFFVKNNYLVIRGALKGHRGVFKEQQQLTAKDWSEDLYLMNCIAKNYADLFNSPLFFLGHSLGAVLQQAYDSQRKNSDFKKYIFFAPALTVRWYVHFLKLIEIFPKDWSLPSKNLKDYRANESTSIASYRALRVQRNKLNYSKLPKVHTLILIDEKDELIDPTKILEIQNKYNLQQWEVFIINDSMTPPPYHLNIDPMSLGDHLWKQLLARIQGFLSD